MSRPISTRLATLAATAAVALSLLVVPSSHAAPDAQARAAVGYGLTIDDGIRAVRTPNDLWKVALYAANSGEPAAVVLNFNDVVPYEGETRVFFNFDKDLRPEAAVAMGGNHYRFYKVRNFRDHGTDADDCGKVDAAMTSVSIAFGPQCLGGTKRGKMAISVVSTYPGARTEFVPGKMTRKWSSKIRTYQPR